MFHRLRGDGEIHLAVRGHFGDLGRGALVHVQGDTRIGPDEALDHRGQRVARLGVRGGDRQAARLRIAELVRRLLDVLGLVEHAVRQIDDGAPGGRNARELTAGTLEDLDAQLVLQQPDLLGHAGLGGEQGLGRGRDVQLVVRDFPDVAELLELHGAPGEIRF